MTQISVIEDATTTPLPTAVLKASRTSSGSEADGTRP